MTHDYCLLYHYGISIEVDKKLFGLIKVLNSTPILRTVDCCQENPLKGRMPYISFDIKYTNISYSENLFITFKDNNNDSCIPNIPDLAKEFEKVGLQYCGYYPNGIIISNKNITSVEFYNNNLCIRWNPIDHTNRLLWD